MNRVGVLLLLVALVGVPVLAQGAFTVGIDQATRDAWDSVVDRFGGQTGLAVTLHPYPASSLAQQVVLQGITRSGKLNLVMVHKDWGTNLGRYLADLGDLERQLAQEGVSLARIDGRPVGVWLPFAPDWFVAVLSWPDDRQAVGEFLVLAGRAAEGAVVEPSKVSPEAVISSFATTKIEASQHNPKLDGSLESLLGAVRATVGPIVGPMAVDLMAKLPASAQAALGGLAKTFGIPFSSTTSTVTVVLKPQTGRASSANVAALSTLGVSRTAIEASTQLIKVSVPLSQLASLATQLAGISFIRPPYIPYPLAVTGQGVAAIGAAAFHTAGITGSGVQVAVIDMGFSGLSAAQARGDLPGSVQQVDLTGTGLTSGITHGTAVAEIVHEVAPGAQLTLIKIADEVDLDQAVTYCLDHGIRIINHSLGWYNTNFYDGTGTIADIAERAIAGGILWVNAGGNEAQSHWEGNFVDGNGDEWLDPSLTFQATGGSQIILYMTWNDWPSASSDYDLYLYGPSGQLVASSTKRQTGTEEPTESIQTSAPSSGTYSVRVKGAGSKQAEIYNLYQGLTPAIASSSILAPGNVSQVVTVGAIDYAHYTTGPQEPYSSQGPTNDGRQKPDLCAPDNVTTGTSPYSPFAGTSGATPHVTGAAALLLSQAPSLSEPALRAKLLDATVSMGDPNIYGRGRLVLSLAAPANQPPGASFTANPSAAAVGAQIAFNASGSSDPDGSIVSYAWRFGDGASGAGVTTNHSYAASGTYTVTLTVTDNGGATNSTTRQVSISVSGRPDLVVESLSHSPDRPAVGEPVSFTIRIRNQGTAGAGSFRVRLEGASGSVVSYVGGLPAGTSTSTTLTLPLSRSPETFRVLVDDLGQVAESNEGNNEATETVQPPAGPPLVADAGGPYSGTVGQPVTLSGAGSSGAISSYQWSFGDGMSGSGVQVAHAYGAPGTYTAALTVIATSGERSTDTAPVTIAQAVTPLSVQISTAKTSYRIGEPIAISYAVNREAYVYLCDIDASGKVLLLFPNAREPNNRVASGSHTLPAGPYTLQVSEPTGTETLYAFAATSRLPNFPTSYGTGFVFLGYDPSGFLNAVRQTLQAQVPPPDRAEAQTSFTVVSAAPQAGILRVTSSPAGAMVLVDGTPIGPTPASGSVAAGTHAVTVSLSGYREETRQVSVSAGQTVTLQVVLSPVVQNRPPVASFNVSPPTPVAGQTVTFDASVSTDPDGWITSYVWDFGDGSHAGGVQASHAYGASGSYPVRLTVTDNQGASSTATGMVMVAGIPAPATGPSTQPPMGGTAGVFVWGTDTWHVTVNAGAGWTAPHAYCLELRTDQAFRNVNQAVSGPVVPLGVVPTPADQGRTIVFEGSLTSGSVDYTFTLPYSKSVWMSLKLDVNGDERLDESSSLVFLRGSMVHPPSAPLVIGLPEGGSGPLVPSMNFRIGTAITYTAVVRFILWSTDIAALEGR